MFCQPPTPHTNKQYHADSALTNYMHYSTGRMAVLNAVTAKASVQWKPADTSPGALFTIEADLDASLLPTGEEGGGQ